VNAARRRESHHRKPDRGIRGIGQMSSWAGKKNNNNDKTKLFYGLTVNIYNPFKNKHVKILKAHIILLTIFVYMLTYYCMFKCAH